MTPQNNSVSAVFSARPNGAGAAAILAVGIGAFLLAALAILGGKSAAAGSAMIFGKPTGPLSGVTMSAIVLWLAAWQFRTHTNATGTSRSRASTQQQSLCLFSVFYSRSS
ncbi:MAG: hypothetical protein ACP5E2_05555 [Terracidiphilus sp.]